MPNKQSVIVAGLLASGVLIYAAISDSSIWSVLTGGSNPVDYSGAVDDTGTPGTGVEPGAPVGTGGAGIGGMIDAANHINAQRLPYVWGGGHASAGTPSGGPPAGFDCSGCVAAVLVGGGFWDVGSSVPNDAGIISALKSKGVIAPGSASGTPSCNIFDNPGDHIFMSLNGAYFGTSDGDGGPNNTTRFGKGGGGGTWLTEGSDVPIFAHYHILPELLSGETNTSSGDNPRGTQIG